MECTTLRFTGHALRRMFERELGRDEVVAVAETSVSKGTEVEVLRWAA